MPNRSPFSNPFSPESLGDYTQTLPTGEEPTFSLPLQRGEESVIDDVEEVRHFPGLFSALIAVTILLGGQCFRLQVTQSAVNRAHAEKNSIRILTTTPGRGLITDSAGSILAQNTAKTALAVDPAALPSKKADRQKVYDALQKQAGVDPDTITLIENNRRQSISGVIVLQNNLDKDKALLYKEQLGTFAGVVIQQEPVRLYTNLPSLGQLLGYVGSVTKSDVASGATLDQQVGKTGLEAHYNNVLTGQPGHQKVEVDAYGKVRDTLPQSNLDAAKTGQTLRLSIDSNLQKSVATALQNELNRRTQRLGPMDNLGAAAVVLDPSTGAVKAMVSLPDYDANLFSGGISKDAYNQLLTNPAHPLFNQNIQGQYPSGSIIKPLIASAALQAGVITGNTQMDTPAALCIGKTCFPDWKTHGHTDTRTAIATSNNIFFYAVGGGWPDKNFNGLGIDRINQYLSQFNIGSSTGIDLPGEASGVLPNPTWKQKMFNQKWYIGDTYNTSIGQGYTLVTPLQMAVAAAAIANGGTVWQPHLAEATVDPITGREVPTPLIALHKDFISDSNLQIVREGMQKTTQPGGSAHALQNLNFCSAGKTGTAQFGTSGQTHAWYTGFAPCDHPTLAFSIFIGGGGESYESSVPVAEEIMRAAFNDPLAPGQQLSSAPKIGIADPFSGER